MNSDYFRVKEYIKSHLIFHASDEVIRRGRELYINKKVFFNEFIEKTDFWKFTVVGSQKYQVHLKGVNSQSIQTSCTCPFDWGSICKHTVAALLFVSDNLGNPSILQQNQLNILSPENKRFGKKNGFEIVNYQLINLDFIRKNTTPYILSQLTYMRNNGYYNPVEITNESAVFTSTVTGVKIEFYKEDGKVFITSPQSASSQKLTHNEVQCLSAIAKSPMPNFLGDVFSGKVLESQKEKLMRFGLPENANFNDYFTYIFKERDGLMFFPSKKGAGLMPVTTITDNYIYEYFRKLNNDDLLLAKLPKKTEHRELGFVLTKSYREFSGYRKNYNDFLDDDEDEISEENNRYNIIPIVGKPAKNNASFFASHIEEYEKGTESKFIVNKSENAEKLLRLIDAIGENKEASFHLLKNAFGYLQNEKYVFGLAKNAYQIRKKDLVEITLSPEPFDVIFEVSENQEFLTLELKIKTDTELRKRKVLESHPKDNYFYVTGNKFYFAKSEKVAQAIADFPDIVKMVATFKDEFFRNLVEPVSKNFEIRFKKNTFESQSVELDFRKKQLFLSERNEYVVFTPCVEYENNVTAMLNTPGTFLYKMAI